MVKSCSSVCLNGMLFASRLFRIASCCNVVVVHALLSYREFAAGGF